MRLKIPPYYGEEGGMWADPTRKRLSEVWQMIHLTLEYLFAYGLYYIIFFKLIAQKKKIE